MIVGPIANDTIYDTWGISTSGLLSREQSLRLLMIGLVYRQTAIKTERAASQLSFISAQVIEEKEIAEYRDKVLEEQDAYQKEFVEVMKLSSRCWPYRGEGVQIPRQRRGFPDGRQQ